MALTERLPRPCADSILTTTCKAGFVMASPILQMMNLRPREGTDFAKARKWQSWNLKRALQPQHAGARLPSRQPCKGPAEGRSLCVEASRSGSWRAEAEGTGEPREAVGRGRK